MDDLEQRLKEGLLEDLIAHMSMGMGDRMKPKSMAVEVEAPSKDKLAEGLDKAKDVLGDEPMDSEESDEQRLMDLLDDEDEEEKE